MTIVRRGPFREAPRFQGAAAFRLLPKAFLEEPGTARRSAAGIIGGIHPRWIENIRRGTLGSPHYLLTLLTDSETKVHLFNTLKMH